MLGPIFITACMKYTIDTKASVPRIGLHITASGPMHKYLLSNLKYLIQVNSHQQIFFFRNIIYFRWNKLLSQENYFILKIPINYNFVCMKKQGS